MAHRLLVLALILSVTAYAVPRYLAKPPPTISVQDTRIDLGAGLPGEVLKGQLVLSNTGSGNLEYDIAASCSCAGLTHSSGSIAAGQTEAIRFGVRMAEYSNSERGVRFVITSNDPNKRSVSCVATGRAPAPFTSDPASVDFGSVNQARLSKLNKTVRLIQVDKGLAGELAIPEITCSNETFIVKDFNGGLGAKRLVNIRISQFAQAGDHYGTVHIRFPKSKAEVRIPLHVQVRGGITLIPSVITRVTSSGNSDRTLPNVLAISHKEEAVDWSSIRVIEGPIAIQQVQTLGKNRCSISFQESAHCNPGNYRVAIVVDGIKMTGVLSYVVAE